MKKLPTLPTHIYAYRYTRYKMLEYVREMQYKYFRDHSLGSAELLFVRNFFQFSRVKLWMITWWTRLIWSKSIYNSHVNIMAIGNHQSEYISEMSFKFVLRTQEKVKISVVLSLLCVLCRFRYSCSINHFFLSRNNIF